MSTVEIKSFPECLAIAAKSVGKNHLILGNGFSVGLFPNIFNYKVLADRVSNLKIKKLFEELKTNDFEYVLRKLTEVIRVLKCYDSSSEIRSKIENDLRELKSTLIEVITSSHPENPNAISDQQYASCHAFLSHFNDGKKYTFNYDLLLYWVFMHFLNDAEKKLKCDDGFRTSSNDESVVAWEIGQERDQNLYYVHGAMHIFSDGSEIEKYTWINSGNTIKEQVKSSLDQSKYPVFITEGSKRQKQNRINNNAYLGRCFSSLKNITGNLFIFGHSLRDEDDHVFDFVNKNSKSKKIFVSLYGNPSLEDNQRIVKKLQKWQSKYSEKEYHLFDASSANVWGSKND